ncbi:MAG: lipopolysaccharide biosynthesis protein [Planctomycetota bacterium]|jgi:O-antigen/teichoic acid export membrane protein
MATIVFITPILLSSLGKYDYGLWVTIGQGISFLLLLDLGIANSIARFISKAEALNNGEDKDSVYSVAVVLCGLAAASALIITLLAARFVPSMLSIEGSRHRIAQLLFLFLGLSVTVIFPLRVGRGLLQAIHRYDYIDMVSILTNLVQCIVIIALFLHKSLDLLVLCSLTIGCNVIAELAIFLKALRLHQGIQFSYKKITKARFWSMFSFGSSSLVQTISAMLYTRGQTIAVGIILGMGMVPLFSIPCAVLIALGPFIGRTGATFMPIASYLDAGGEINRLVKLATYGLRYGLMLGLCIGLYILLFGRDILALWLRNSEMNQPDINAMHMALIVMAFPLVFARANKGNQTILRATGSHWFVSNSLFVCSVIGLLISVVLMKYSSLGIMGAAIGWAVKVIVPEGILCTMLVLKKYNIAKGNYFKKAYGPPLVASIPILLINGALVNCISVDVASNAIAYSAVYFLTAVVCTFLFCVDEEHKSLLFGFVKRKFGHV